MGVFVVASFLGWELLVVGQELAIEDLNRLVECEWGLELELELEFDGVRVGVGRVVALITLQVRIVVRVVFVLAC